MPKRHFKCGHCNTHFESYEKSPKYCSRECWKKGHIPWNKGKKLDYMPPTAFKKGQNLGEKHPRWSGGKWSWAKKFVLERDKGTCQKCGLREGKIMDVAHLKGHENGGLDRRYVSHNPEHLITLCPNCHRRYDLGKIQLQQKTAHLKSR